MAMVLLREEIINYCCLARITFWFHNLMMMMMERWYADTQLPYMEDFLGAGEKETNNQTKKEMPWRMDELMGMD